MPYATNPVDGVRTYFEDSGGAGPPVLFFTGFADPLEVAKSSRLARALSGEFRLIFGDHRGQGGSDKPREANAYALATRGWADPRAIEALRGSYARYDADEVRRALLATMDAFERFERETAERLGFSPSLGRDPVRALIVAVLA